jgi:hypothetical protein
MNAKRINDFRFATKNAVAFSVGAMVRVPSVSIERSRRELGGE